MVEYLEFKLRKSWLLLAEVALDSLINASKHYSSSYVRASLKGI